MLEQIDQAKRNAGDQNFFQRAILRASNRMKRKKKANKDRNEPLRSPGSISITEEAKYRSLDRSTSPNLSVNLDDETFLSKFQINRSQTNPSRLYSHKNDEPPDLPKKQSSKASLTSVGTQQNAKTSSGDPNQKPRSMTTRDIANAKKESKQTEKDAHNQPKVFMSAEALALDKDSEHSSSSSSKDNDSGIVNRKQSETALFTDKTDINVRLQKRSVDSMIVNSYKSPARYAIDKTRRGSKKQLTQKTPTPPPRSPVSLGLQPDDIEATKFQFPSVEKLNDSTDGTEETANGSSGLLAEIDSQIETDALDDPFASSNDDIHYSSEVVDNNNTSCDHVYGNIGIAKVVNENTLSVQDIHRREHSRRPGSAKHLSDPLSCEHWTAATGDGKVVSSLQHLSDKPSDYINVMGPGNVNSDDDNDSYVNVTSGDAAVKPKKNKPAPIRLTSYRNEFDKYDDEDNQIYHAVGAVDAVSSADSLVHRHQSSGSYENVNAPTTLTNTKSDYLNLMSPPKTKPQLNYVMVSKLEGSSPGSHSSKSNSASPVRKEQWPAIETYDQTNYTRIDQTATNALTKSMQQQRQLRDKHVTNKK